MNYPLQNLLRPMKATAHIAFACSLASACLIVGQPGEHTVQPVTVTETVKHDTDDPALWINHENPGESIVFGTDKDADGAVYAFDLNGKLLEDKTIRNIQRPNNIDVEYGIPFNGQQKDIIVFTERERMMLRVFSVPDMMPLDNGGIPVFAGEQTGDFMQPMGVALYKNPKNDSVYAIVGRKFGPTDGTYLWQYTLSVSADGNITANVVRKFGQFSGKKEIESIAVDDELGFVYYSDEGVGIRKYYANPKGGNEELLLFGTEGFANDMEGIAVVDAGGGQGKLVISDQGANSIRVFERTGNNAFVKSVTYAAQQTDGLDISTFNFGPGFPKGLLVAMSDDRTFHYYRLEDLGLE